MSPGAKANIVRAKTSEMLQAETEEVKKEVKEIYSRMQKGKKNKKNTNMELELDPFTRSNNIAECAATFETIFEHLEKLTGWKFSVLMGGPDPLDEDKIVAGSFHYGRTSAEVDFADAFTGFESTMTAYQKFLVRVYEDAALTDSNGSTSQRADNNQLDSNAASTTSSTASEQHVENDHESDSDRSDEDQSDDDDENEVGGKMRTLVGSSVSTATGLEAYKIVATQNAPTVATHIHNRHTVATSSSGYVPLPNVATPADTSNSAPPTSTPTAPAFDPNNPNSISSNGIGFFPEMTNEIDWNALSAPITPSRNITDTLYAPFTQEELDRLNQINVPMALDPNDPGLSNNFAPWPANFDGLFGNMSATSSHASADPTDAFWASLNNPQPQDSSSDCCPADPVLPMPSSFSSTSVPTPLAERSADSLVQPEEAEATNIRVPVVSQDLVSEGASVKEDSGSGRGKRKTCPSRRFERDNAIGHPGKENIPPVQMQAPTQEKKTSKKGSKRQAATSGKGSEKKKRKTSA
ncbi:hypothetical protein BJ138DRAFT_1118705 [Hygrophoropsis aurantiaca]|uniref:Uncharacterized protein n=1 Tax=Hygrophoropsis aurantiaca TaxID=72124 RepID=A0ACB7ZVL9_9AGAM|nr:hypothetical protein BJ138DRAFT_1118705 [Hygrophoropsis aurantiaca]